MGFKTVLAISSSGGHWIQLRRVTRSLQRCKIIYASPGSHPELEEKGETHYSIPDASRWDRFRLVWMASRVAFIVIWLRPDVIISTGAAPGFVALRIGKLIGIRCLWLDSIANVAAVSLSGQKIAPHSDLCLTQWAHLDDGRQIKYAGSVLPGSDA